MYHLCCYLSPFPPSTTHFQCVLLQIRFSFEFGVVPSWFSRTHPYVSYQEKDLALYDHYEKRNYIYLPSNKNTP